MPASMNDIDVGRHLTGLLRHEEPLDEFIDWFHPANWLIERFGTEEAYDMASDVELLLAELSGGWLDDDGVLVRMQEIAEEHGVEWRAAAEMPGAPRLAS